MWSLTLRYDDALSRPNTWRLLDGHLVARARYAEGPETPVCCRLRWRGAAENAGALQLHPFGGEAQGEWLVEPWAAFGAVAPCGLRLLGAPPRVADVLSGL